MTCPASWLDLEQYAIGELAPAVVVELEAHLDGCAACRADMHTILDDRRPLPRLASRSRWRSWWALAPAGLVAAAGALMVVGAGESEERRKGGDVSISLVVQRGAEIVENPRFHIAGDRVQAMLTCPDSGTPEAWQWVVFEGDAMGVSVGSGRVDCANDLLLPGAFEVTGDADVEVCVALDPPEAPWFTSEDLAERRHCVRLLAGD